MNEYEQQVKAGRRTIRSCVAGGGGGRVTKLSVRLGGGRRRRANSTRGVGGGRFTRRVATLHLLVLIAATKLYNPAQHRRTPFPNYFAFFQTICCVRFPCRCRRCSFIDYAKQVP